VGLGSTTVGIELSDVAVLAVAAAAVVSGVREGWDPLRSGGRIWLFGSTFLALVVAATIYPLVRTEHYDFLTHAVTAAKFCEYGLLAPSVPLLLRRRGDLAPLLWTAAGWSALASGWAVLQFAGVVDEIEGRRPLRREPSFVGFHDFAALSGAALSIAFAVFLLGRGSRIERSLGIVAGAAGATGIIMCGAATGIAGSALAAAAVIAVALIRQRVTTRRLVAVIAVLALATAGVLLMRGGELVRTARAFGVGSNPEAGRSIESFQERSLLMYIGGRIFLDHPLVGVGWQGSEELENYQPYLADARRRFPDAPQIAFPSPEHAWGVQNAYLQTLSDLGLLGALCVLALVAAGVTLAVRTTLRAPPDALVPAVIGLLWLLVAAGVWNGVGLVAGIPLDALTWLAFGLVGASAAWADCAGD
jgi:O-antigen ligase